MDRRDAEPIAVYCDDPRHVRGRVAKLGDLYVLSWHEGWAWFYGGPRRSGAPGHGATRFDHGGRSALFTCPLCPRSPALSDDLLDRACDALALQGQTRVSLAVLDALAANLER